MGAPLNFCLRPTGQFFTSVGYVFGVSSDKKHRVRARTSTPTVVFASVGYMFLVYIMTKNIDVLQERLYSFS